MRNFYRFLVSLIVLVSATALSAAPPQVSSGVIASGPASIHDTAYIESGELLMMVNNRGSFAYDATAHFGINDGLRYPADCPWTVMYAAGLWLGAKVGDQVRVSTAEYSFDYMPGVITGGIASPDDPAFRVYKIRSGDSYESSQDYADWPFALGAPATKNYLGQDSMDAEGRRIPLLLGDEAAWTVFNDADMTSHDSGPGSESPGPLGIEVQLYSYTFDSAGPLGRIVFLDYKLINKGSSDLDSLHIAFWSDPDVGGPGDDLVGCDTILDLGFCYNAYSTDAVYKTNPPSVGIVLLNGPILASPGDRAWIPHQQSPVADFRNLGMTAFARYYNGIDPSDRTHTWNYLRGLRSDGTELIDPFTQQVTTFACSGYPISQTGWIDNTPTDRRFMLTSGPLAIAQGDTQSVSIAVVVGSEYPFDCFLDYHADTVYADHVSGESAGRVFALVAQPDSTTGHDYQITFSGPMSDINWSLYDLTLGITRLANQRNITGTGEFPIVDGIAVKAIGPPPGIGSWEVLTGSRHFSWIEGNGLSLEGFNGAMGWNSPCHLLDTCSKRAVPLDRLRRVLLQHAQRSQGTCNAVLTDSNLSYAYRYLQHANNPLAHDIFELFVTNQSEDFAFQGFKKSVPLAAWDIDAIPPRRLVVGHLENNVMFGWLDGKYCPPTLSENTSETSPREWLFIFDADYSETIDSAFAVNLLNPDLPIMYTITATSRSPAAWQSGDDFLIVPSSPDSLFSEQDVFKLTAPASSALVAAHGILGGAASLSDLKGVARLAKDKFRELHWTCACPCFADPECAGGEESEINILDIVGFIDVAFRGIPASSDRPCPTERTDVTCDYVTDIRDVVTVIDVAFRNADPSVRFCNPCNQP